MVGWSIGQTDRQIKRQTGCSLSLASVSDGQYCKSASPRESTSTRASAGVQAGRRRRGGGGGGGSTARWAVWVFESHGVSKKNYYKKQNRKNSVRGVERERERVSCSFAHHHLHCHTTGMFSAEQDASPHLTSSVLVLRRNTFFFPRFFFFFLFSRTPLFLCRKKKLQKETQNKNKKPNQQKQHCLFSSQIHACC